MSPFFKVLVVLTALIGTSVGNRPEPCYSREYCPPSQYQKKNWDVGGYPGNYGDTYEQESKSWFPNEQGRRQSYGRKTDDEYEHVFGEYDKKWDGEKYGRGAREGNGRGGYGEGYGRGFSEGYGSRSGEKYGRAPEGGYGREFEDKYDHGSSEKYGRGDSGGYDHGPDNEYKPERDENDKKYDTGRDGAVLGGGHGYESEEAFGGMYMGSYDEPYDFAGENSESYGRSSRGRAGNNEEQNDEEGDGEVNRTQRSRNSAARVDNTQNQARADRERTPNTNSAGAETAAETGPSNSGGFINGFLPILGTGANGGFANGFGGNFGQGLGAATNAGDSGVAGGRSQ